MKKFLRDNKGVIIFYAELVIITLIVLNNLQKGSDKMINNDDMIRISLLTLLSIVIGAIITYVGFTYNRYDVNRDGKVTSADYVEIKNYIMEK